MPDHMHMIITISAQIEKKEDKEWIYSNPKSPSHTIGAIIRGFKGASTKKINLFLNRTGELPFAPTTELPFAPTSELPFAPTSESPFAPTFESQFAPIQSPFAPTNSSEFYKYKIFQRNYYEHIIRNENDYNRIERYIIDNPINWKKKKLNLKIDE
jgi:REP element-mobilizing transposase RayT